MFLRLDEPDYFNMAEPEPPEPRDAEPFETEPESPIAVSSSPATTEIESPSTIPSSPRVAVDPESGLDME